MKLQSNNLLETLTINEIKLLTSEVKESVMHNFKNDRKKIFSAAELWNIQSGRKSIFSRRLYL